MTFVLPTTGTDPKIATKGELETAINAEFALVALAAASGFPIYADTAAGLAATTEGEGFSVIGASYLVLYRNESATAVEQGQMPLKSVTDALSASLVFQSSMLDTTAGRVLRMEAGGTGGPFGLGESLQETTDWDNLTSSGFYFVYNSVTNQPTSGFNWVCLVMRSNNHNNVVQLAFNTSSDAMFYTRRRASATWEDWRRIDSDQALLTTSDVAFATVDGRDVATDGAKLDTITLKKQYLTVTALLTDTTGYSFFSAGEYVKVIDGNHTYIVLASGSTAHVENDAGTAVAFDVIQETGGFNAGAWGVDPTGAATCSAAALIALDAAIAAETILVWPAGTFLLSTAVSTTSANEDYGMRGAHNGVTEFVVPSGNTTGAFQIVSSGRQQEADFRDFKIVTEGNSGYGLRVTQPEGGASHQRSIVVTNVTVRGDNDTSDHFDAPFDFTGCFRPYLDNVIYDGPWFGLGLENASARFSTPVGINLTGCYAPSLNNCYVFGAYIAVLSDNYLGVITGVTDQGGGVVRVTVSNPPHIFSTGAKTTIFGTTSYNGLHTVTNVSTTQFDITASYVASETGSAMPEHGPEGFTMDGCVLNGNRIGLKAVRYNNSREPLFFLTNNHVNSRDDNFLIDGVKLLMASNNNTYNEDTGGEYSGIPHDFYLKNCSEYIITGHIFHFTGATDRINIFVESDTSGEGDIGIISNNLFNSACTRCIWLSSNVGNTQVFGNKIGITPSVEFMQDVADNAALLHAGSDGLWGIGTATPTEALDIAGDAIRIRTADIPASATADGTAGTIKWGADYVYVCTGTNTWKRSAISTW